MYTFPSYLRRTHPWGYHLNFSLSIYSHILSLHYPCSASYTDTARERERDLLLFLSRASLFCFYCLLCVEPTPSKMKVRLPLSTWNLSRDHIVRSHQFFVLVGLLMGALSSVTCHASCIKSLCIWGRSYIYIIPSARTSF